MNLSGLSAVYPGYSAQRRTDTDTDLQDERLQDARRDALAKAAYGSALQMLAQSGPQAPPPGQMSQPQQGQQPPMPGMSPGGPQGPQMQPPGMMPQAQPPMAPPQGPADFNQRFSAANLPTSGPPGMPQGPQMQPPGMPQQPPGMPPGMQQPRPQGQQQLDWRSIVQAVQKANPNIDPAVMAKAVDQFMPMMNQQSQQEWRQLSLQIREQAIQSRETMLLTAERGRTERSTAVNDTRRQIADTNADTRLDIAGAAEEGRNRRADQSVTARRDIAGDNRTQREQQFQQREQRLQQSLKLREDSTWARLEQQKQQATARLAQGADRQALSEWRAVLDAQHKHTIERIQAYSINNNMPAAERKKMLDDAEQSYRQQLEEMRTKFGHTTPTNNQPTNNQPAAQPGQPKIQDRATTPQQPAASTPVPDAYKNDPDGTVYEKDGKKWVKQGDKLTPQP